ncbi:hypothetical protein HY993_04295 [Candidatus Micrarchaeota archaeon]|nr:hypothetical protein [Candidatus Micrarchaeota archaeon]
MPSLIEQIKTRVQSLNPAEIAVTNYAKSRAEQRGIDAQLACENIVSSQNAFWKLSSFNGVAGKRVEVYLRVSKRNSHKYVIEANSCVFLINAMNINTRIQKRLRRV